MECQLTAAATTYQKRPRSERPHTIPLLLSLSTLLLLSTLSGCQTRPAPASRPAEAAGGVGGAAQQAPPLPQAPVYRVNPQSSEVRVLVYRGGPLARFGHNHVIVAPLRGEVRAGDTSAGSGFRIELAVDDLRVDPPRARAVEGAAFADPVSDQARQGTRHNMLGDRMLDAADHPQIVVRSVALEGPRWNPDVTANVTVRGTTSTVTFPAAVVRQGDTMTVIAKLALHLSAFGIAPFTILGGGLKVEDRIDLRVRVVAERSP